MCDKLIAAIKNIELESKNSDLIKTCQHVVESLKNNSTTTEEVIIALSEYILNFEDAVLLKKYLSNILLALVSLQIPLKPVFSSTNYDQCNGLEKTHHLEYSVTLALLSDHPDILQYALKYFQINAIPPYEVFIHHEDSYNVAPKKRRLLDCRHKITDHQIVSCCYTLLSKLPNELSSKWDWTKFITNFSHHESSEIRWMVKECMATLTYMTEAQSNLLSKNLSLTQGDCLKNIPHTKEIHIINANVDELDLNIKSIINIDGILLPVFDESNVQPDNLVPVKSTISSLRSLALTVASGKGLLLTGPVGSGKTSLVEHLAAVTGRKGVAFKKVQLGDQTDSRMLLGSHQCTDIPGEFVWAPGVLTEAVQNGHWLLLEDIDCAALDVASTLSSLLERNSLCVPGYRDDLPVTPGFQLFVTQRTVVTNYGFQKRMSNSSTLLQKHLTQINVEPLSRSELAEIIQSKYPVLATICSKMIEVFMMFSVGSHDASLQTTDIAEKDSTFSALKGSRLVSTRDLMKWCARAVRGFNVSSPESALKVLQDALNIFTCSISSLEHRLALSKKVGTCLGIVETKSEFYCKHYKPNIALHSNSMDVGRVKVPRVEKRLSLIDFDNKEAVFSFTRQAACLLEKIACCVSSNEPVLLVGETGTGKTSSIQYLAKQTGHKLVVINMNQQSDSADLLGGYKPVDLKFVIRPIKTAFIEMFKGFYNVEKNKKFIGHIETCYDTENWSALLTLMKQSHKAAINRLVHEKKDDILNMWLAFGHKLTKLEQQVKAASKLTFAFIEGSLVKAMQQGHWVLLDEINLASAEILECLAGLLEHKSESIELLEKGDKVPIKRHPDFTLFACMNPATDIGKKDLPVGLRNRFTEIFIDELTERNDLMLLIGDYLYHMNLSGSVLEAIYHFYASIKKEAKLNLVDGAGNAPHYSLRTLCRALTAAAKANCGTISRSLYEAFCLSFLTQLDRSSHPKVESMIAKAVMGKKNLNSILKQSIPEPKVDGQNFLLFEGHWIPQGNLDIDIPEGYVLTTTVRKNLRDIARIISLGRLPVLLQGDTSVGKTSLITYIAKASGNYCVRINNHEHTDLQEYIGSYAADSSGNLIFKEGVLVEAMRKGYWIILDELNLAPSDVLEALNRVLDDNRELFIPETQQVVKADPNFMLFATQNPPGLYGGRKMLSRAFRNRFVELHFDEIPRAELKSILHQRCHIPTTYCNKMIEVMAELQVRRRGSAAVQGKDGFITLRDLFRWGQRYKQASKDILTAQKFYDWDQHIADEGYLILAGKVRQIDERNVIEQVIEKYIKRKVNPNNLFSLHQNTSPVTKSILEMILNNPLSEFSHIVWTYNMRRLAVLIAKSFTFNEPVLLVGETGCGKTSICQILAALSHRQLLSVNCHMHTESSDFLGGLRPVRQYKNDGKLFEWVDGPLIKAMEKGHLFLADEISLADDSVLERLNSLLEPERQLVLSERGMENNSDIIVITAVQNFHFIGTMNPGGDFGKKELSPALRNRFTEIWCDHVNSREDLLKVLEKSVSKGIALGNQEDGSSGIGNCILDFTDWLKNSEGTNKFPFSIRDLLSWVQFINTAVSKSLLDVSEAYVHGACMTFLDCFGTALTGHIDATTLVALRQNAVKFLLSQINIFGTEYTQSLQEMFTNKQLVVVAESNNAKFGIKPFCIECGPYINLNEKEAFTFTAPTTGSNTLRLLRGLQLNKAILLEGNPGVGKTSLVTALAKSSGHRVVRINLSDQTDITDLFGTDLPTEDGSFKFKEGAFLNALQNGDWILLDELNLAPQPVLEGLNACLDHRGEIFIPELGRTFKVQNQTKLFACQNPLKQGGGRRGLPVSFLNRFTQVYIDTLTKEDLIYILESQYPELSSDVLNKIVEFNCKVAHEITEIQIWGHKGSPWEMNLRDIQRWCEALIDDSKCGKRICPGKYVHMLYVNRMRTEEDKAHMVQIYDHIFCPEHPRSDNNPQITISDTEIIIGNVTLQRNGEMAFKRRPSVETNLLILRNQLPTLKALAQNVKMNWLSILVGPTAAGKSSVVQVLADLTGNDLHVVPVTSAMDVADLLGGFEQVDYNKSLESFYSEIETITILIVRHSWTLKEVKQWRCNQLLSNLLKFKKFQNNCLSKDHAANDISEFQEKLQCLLNHCEKLSQYATSSNLTTDKIEKVASQMLHLKKKVSALTSVNAGGKFEWIDSLLVKTLIEGSWLLLDNVNLTSAAVLDRLNGLLEPNGVLNIAERGGISEIRPHPNFRVFFTMDPKYGEISRAMRNRGVEIYILRSDDPDLRLSETLNYMDLVALLSSCGLPNEYHDICIRLHESMADFITGIEKPTVSHLLQAAHLTWQQLIRGISGTTALLSSFSDVYIKSRNGSDFASPVIMSLAEMKNTMLKALEYAIGSEHYEPVVSNDVSHTLTVKGLSLNSSFVIAKQITHLVIQDTIDLEITPEYATQTLFCLLTAYQKCPPALYEVIRHIIKENININDANKLKALKFQLNEKAFEFLYNEKESESYKRFFPETYEVSPEAVSEMNTEFTLLYMELQNIVMKMFPGNTTFSALDYSIAVFDGKLADDFVDYPILKHCKIYLEVVDQYIKYAIKSARIFLNDHLACLIVQLLSWRARFVKICSLPIFEKLSNKRSQILRDEIIPLLNIHRKWVEKHLLGELFKLPPNQRFFDKFSNELKFLLLSTENDNSKIVKLGKKIRKCYGQPNLHKNQNEYDLSVLRAELYNRINLDINESIDRQLHKVLQVPACMSDVMLAVDVPETESIKIFGEKVAQVTENKSDSTNSGMHIRLIPVNLYILQRIINLLQPYLLIVVSTIADHERDSEIITHNFVSILISFIETANSVKGFPAALWNNFKLIRNKLEGSADIDFQRISSLPAVFWSELYNMLACSPVTYPIPFLNQNNLPCSEEIVETIVANTKRISTNLPLLPYCLQKLTTFVDQSNAHPLLAYEKVSLKNRMEYSTQLEILTSTLWKNIASLDLAAVTKQNIDADFEMQKYVQLINYVYQFISEPNRVNETTNISYDKILPALEVYFKDDKNFLDLFKKAGVVHESLIIMTSQNINITSSKTKVKILSAELSLLTSVILIRIMAEISPIDHVEKYRLKVQYIEEDIDMFNKLLSAYYFHGVITGTINENRKIQKASQVTTDFYKDGSENQEKLIKVHSYCKIIMKLKESTAQRVHKYASGNTFRPKDPSYGNFVKDCRHFTKSILSDKTITSISTNLISTANKLYEVIETNMQDQNILKDARTIVKETASWMFSVKAFKMKVETTYSEAFPDLAKPLQNSLSQMIYSILAISDLINELITKIEQGPYLKNALISLLEYPNIIPEKEAREKHFNRFISANFMQILKRNVMAVTEDVFQTESACLEVLKMNLSELSMNCMASERIDKVSINSVLVTLNALVKAWEKQRQDIEKKQQDEEALYVTKSKCQDEDEEATAYEEIMEMFPSYSESDFGEFKPPTLEQKKIKEPAQKTKNLITTDDVSLIYKWHSNFVRNMTSTEWLTSPKKLVGNDVLKPLLLRYPTFSGVIQDAWEALDADFESRVTPSFLVLISYIKEKIDGSDSSSQKVDFYRSPWVSETRECVPLLHKVRENTNELLEQWPDFPTLKDIIVIVDRILDFPIISPLSRFLTGLELLRDKIEEWNKNAHKANNMIDISLAVGQQIINWRKLEMGHWKECLNNLYQRKQSEAHKYWFYMYAVVNSYLEPNCDESVSSARVVSVLKDFMEKSNLAEFEVRLDIVYIYHCHLVHLERSQRRDELLSILWNTYNYYKQFSPQVAAQIKEKRMPIEKKLRDFVKICTWDRDLSYWSVKDTVEKAHKALHKHTKEFEKILKENVASCLVDNTSEVGADHVGIWDRPKRTTGANVPTGGAYMIDPQIYIVLARNIKKYLDQSEQPCSILSQDSLLSKIPNLLNKAKTLCKDTITNTGYPSLVQALDDFVTLVIETSAHLGSLEVDTSATKEKQTSQAKNIVQIKRKSLADLFKYLTKMGLNYRTGLVILSVSEELYDFTIPPVDLDSAMSYLKSRRCDPALSLVWSGCEKYFQKNIARHRLFSIALQTPHGDLGMQNMERCKGFAAQLLKITNTQKKSISKYTRYICDLRTVTTNLTNVLEADISHSKTSILKEKLNILVECYAHASILLDQFSIVLKSIPENTNNLEPMPEFDIVLSDSPLARCFLNNDEWRDLYNKLKAIISIVDKQKTALHKLSNSIPKQIGEVRNLPNISQNHIDVTNEAKINMEMIIQKCEAILQEYQFTTRTKIIEEFIPQHPILRCIENLSQHLKDTKKHVDTSLGEDVDQEMDEITADTIISQTEDIVATMLLTIQTLYKNHLPPDKSTDNVDVLSAIDEIIDEASKLQEESKEILEERHLKELLQEKLSIDTKMLQLNMLINKIHLLLLNYVQYISTRSDTDDIKIVVMRLVPILEQTVLFVQYFLSQMVAVHRVSCKMLSVLLKIFSDLAIKGFCKPADLDMEEGEGDGGPGKLSSGMGLGEGEGQKDVSERIENQDQLDDARRPGEEKNQEDKDCKEEEKGVNMTDDFDSHLQDVEQKENEDSDQDNENSDADKQMGDTDNAAEKLDQQIWGSEDEEDLEQDSDKKEKEERGKGESTGEKEMAAKEKEQGQDDAVDGKDKQKKDGINEMEDPEIDDDHVDPYHGNQQQLPEPEDFQMPENIDVDGDEVNDEDGETETENPFEIDAMKETIQEDEQSKEQEEKANKNGLEVSSDEDDGEGKDDANEDHDQQLEGEKEENKKDDVEEENEDDDGNKGDDTNAQLDHENPDPESQEEKDSEPKDEENLPQNPESINDEEKVQEEHESNPQANPSNDDPTAEDRVENAEMERGTNDNVETNADQAKDEDAAPYEQAQEQVGEDVQSTGRSELDKSDKGHRGEKQAARAETSQDNQKRFENKPGKTDHERTLGDVNENKHKKAHTLNVEKEDAENEGGGADKGKDEEADAYQHVKQAKKDDLQVVDAATKEQADEQPTLQRNEDEAGEKLKEDEEIPMDVDDDDIQVDKSEELNPQKLKDGHDKEQDKTGNKKEGGEEVTGETGIDVDGDTVMTELVPRGRLTTYHTRLQETSDQVADMTMEQYVSLREWLDSGAVHGSSASAAAWRSVWNDSSSAARALCERLRLVLDPTGRSRMAGDFRTGRAINMRRVIPYIASHFRKDRIWLRRTKPAKREYKIAIAIDDSSSMADNRSKELAFESLALVSQALNLLESGELAVLSFGEKPHLLHPFIEQFSEHSGSKILEQLKFDQTKTKVAQLLDFCTVMFEEQTTRSDAVNAKLLVIVSDGRGIFSEGETRVIQAVRRARQQGIFLVYVIIDNPDNKDSIMDIRRPILDPITNSLDGFAPYLDTFPFPFYLILRDMAALPTVLGDALRQWFELAANAAS